MSTADTLRRHATQRLHERAPCTTDAVIQSTDADLLVQELQIHRIELELQNEELKSSKTEVDVGLEKYTDLYDFAPVGYLCLDPQTRILDANFAGATLLRVERTLLSGRAFTAFLNTPDRARFRTFLRRVFSTHKKQSCELTLLSSKLPAIGVELQAIASRTATGSPATCRVAVIDITSRREAEETRRNIHTLATANRGLNAEIARRKVVEIALKKSELQTRRHLEQARDLQEKLRLISHRILLMQEEQRKKLSRELHDDISQLLVGIIVHLTHFAKSAELNPAGIRRSIPPLRRLVEKSVRIVHRFARELRPAMLDDLGLVPALEAYIADRPKVKDQRVTFTAKPGVYNLDNVTRTALFRIAQEALTNIRKHARAHAVKVTLVRTRGWVTLEVTDDGCSFNANQASRLTSPARRNHLGLIGMRERVEMVGGRFVITSAPGKGTTIHAKVPTGRKPTRY